MFRGSALLPWVVRTRRSASLPCPMRSQQVATLPWFRAGGGCLVPLFAAQSRHEEPYPPMSRINSTFPFSMPFKGNVEEYTPFPRRFQAGIAVLGKCGRIRESCMDNETSTKMVGPPRRGGRHGSPLTRQKLSMAARSASGPYQFCRLHDSRMRLGNAAFSGRAARKGFHWKVGGPRPPGPPGPPGVWHGRACAPCH